MVSKHGNCHQNLLWGVGPTYYCITFLLESDSCWPLATKYASCFIIRNSLWLEFWQRAAFFAVRIFLAAISVFVEATFYRTIVDKINERVGRYYFTMMFFSAGMWSASTCRSLCCPPMYEIWSSHQLSCHLHSPCTPLLWPFLTRLRRIARKTTVGP